MSKKNRNAKPEPPVETSPVETSPVETSPVETSPVADGIVTLTRVKPGIYVIPGRKGNVYFSLSLFDGETPRTITLSGVTLSSPKVPAAKLTEAERAARKADAKAKRASETPADKARRALELAVKMAKRAAQLQAEADKLAQAETVSA